MYFVSKKQAQFFTKQCSVYNFDWGYSFCDQNSKDFCGNRSLFYKQIVLITLSLEVDCQLLGCNISVKMNLLFQQIVTFLMCCISKLSVFPISMLVTLASLQTWIGVADYKSDCVSWAFCSQYRVHCAMLLLCLDLGRHFLQSKSWLRNLLSRIRTNTVAVKETFSQ